MITSIELNNIQSHEHTVVNLTEGVNTIIGSTCAGKTAILRGLYWVIYNTKGASSVLNSNWNKNSKGDLVKELSVIVTTEKGWVKRYRNRESNGYIIHYVDGTEHKLEAVKTDVPEEVMLFLNVNDINVQKQMDAPFLLSESAPEAARYLNSIVHLDDIDFTLSNGEKDKRNINSNINYVESTLNDNQKKLEELSFVDESVSLLNRVKRFDEQIEEVENQICEIEKQLKEFENIKDYSEHLKLIDEIESIDPEENNSEIMRLWNEIKMFDKVKDYSEHLKLINEIESVEIPDVSELKDEIDRFNRNKIQYESSNERAKRLEELLPNVCPLCGKPLKECKDA